MTIITFTPEKQSLISDFLKTHCGGRKWHEVKAKKQVPRRRRMRMVLSLKMPPIIAEREAAELARQARLEMPSERHYEGVDMTHQPIVKTESSVAVYKSIFNLMDASDDELNLMVVTFRFYLERLALYSVGFNTAKLRTPQPSYEFVQRISGLMEVEIKLAMLKQMSFNKQESLNNDLEVINDLYAIYNRSELAMLNSHYGDPEMLFAKRVTKAKDKGGKFRKVVNYILNNPLSHGISDKRLDKIGDDMFNQVGKKFISRQQARFGKHYG